MKTSKLKKKKTDNFNYILLMRIFCKLKSLENYKHNMKKIYATDIRRIMRLLNECTHFLRTIHNKFQKHT